MPNRATQLVQLLRSTNREKRLGTVILFVTSRCNAFCKTCFYHEELNQPGDLTFEQIDKISRTMPSITDLWLSGGGADAAPRRFGNYRNVCQKQRRQSHHYPYKRSHQVTRV